MTQALKASLELNSKRNTVIYLFEVVNRYAKESSEMRETMFVEIQQIFMRYLFDRRGFMQDIASKGLSLVYQLGNEEQKQLLITSLQDTFSGNGPTKKKEQDDQQEMLLDFGDKTMVEQREKLKTYKDLVRVAEELG
jgi:proteasome component ECM29